MNQADVMTFAKQGNQAAIDQIVSDHIKFIKALSRRYRFELQNDAVQYGVLGLLEAIPRFDMGKQFKFITYATFWIRKRMRQLIEVDPDQQLQAVNTHCDDDGDNLTLDDEIPAPEEPKFSKQLHDSILELSEMEREVIKLKYFEGLTIREIGDIVELSFQRVHQIEHKALGKLKLSLYQR